MESLSRWYDVDVIFQDDLKEKRFSGTVSRFDDMGKVLEIIQMTGSVRFKVDGRRIFVMK